MTYYAIWYAYTKPQAGTQSNDHRTDETNGEAHPDSRLREKGMGWLKSPKRALYNKLYRKTSFSIWNIFK